MSEDRPGRGADQFPLRLPEGMRERIKEAARLSGRSMNSEIIARLEDTFSVGEPPTSPEELAKFMAEMRAVLRVYTKRPDVFLGDSDESDKLIEKEMKRAPSKSKRQGAK